MKVSSTAIVALLSLSSCVVEGRVRGLKKGDIAEGRVLKKEEDDAVLAAEEGLPMLQILGNNGDFDDKDYPLGLCQGECDTDADCQEGLMCFQRDPDQSVPGCQDGGQGFDSRGDYCVAMPTEETPMGDMGGADGGVESEVATGAPTEVSTGVLEEVAPIPCTMEMAYCPDGTPMQRDTDCQWMDELCPATMAPTEDEEVETAIMAMEQESESPTTSSPTEEMPSLEVVGQNGNPASAFPLQLCQGDCDDDDECDEGMVCLQRDRFDPVPGCAYNGLDFTTDFCVAAGTPAPSAEGTSE